MSGKKTLWAAFAVLLLGVIVILSYRAGYTMGSDMAERDNRVDAAE